MFLSPNDDFRGLANLRGFPPKIILLVLGNSTNQKILEILTNLKFEIVATLAAPEIGFIEILGDQRITF